MSFKKKMYVQVARIESTFTQLNLKLGLRESLVERF